MIRHLLTLALTPLFLNPLTAETLILKASTDFRTELDGFAPYYIERLDEDPALHGLAIRPPQFPNQWAGSEAIFPLQDGWFTVTLIAVAEEDGETPYRLIHNDKMLDDERVNAPQHEKRVETPHTWGPLHLKQGDSIGVAAKAVSNGNIPEGEGYAWARGRWRRLVIERVPAPETTHSAEAPAAAQE